MRVKETVKGVTSTEIISKRKVNNFIYTSLLKKRTPQAIGSQGNWLRDLRAQNDCEGEGVTCQLEGSIHNCL